MFSPEDLEWPGFKISSKGISMLPDYIEAVEGITEQQDVT